MNKKENNNAADDNNNNNNNNNNGDDNNINNNNNNKWILQFHSRAQSKNERQQKDSQILGLCKKKMYWMKVIVIPIIVGTLWTVPKGLEKKTGGIGNQRKN